MTTDKHFVNKKIIKSMACKEVQDHAMASFPLPRKYFLKFRLITIIFVSDDQD